MMNSYLDSPLTGSRGSPDWSENPLGVDPNSLSNGSGVIGGGNIGNGTTGNIMATSLYTNALLSVVNGFLQANAINKQAQYQKQQLDFAAQVGDIQAQEAYSQGAKEASQIDVKAQQEKGDARANAAAAGVDVNSGSAADVQRSVDTVAAEDILTAKNNAARAAFGYETNSISQRSQGNMDVIGAQAKGTQTILTGGINAASYGAQGYYYQNGGKIKADERSW